MKSPVESWLLKGELEDKLGAPVKEGDELQEIGPIDSLKSELTVNERDIQYLVEQQNKGGEIRGRLATTSMPTEKYGFKVVRVVPMGDAKEGTNAFKVYATLDGRNDIWRPGMMGEARVDVNKRSIAWIWTHRLVDWVRLKLWLPF